ncbi:MAG TPA: hypothetical protein VG168_13670 [Bryobacteraceae bacterium]|nr:hypothetical protein [Bryobacteraceae bacterium]
MAEMGYTLQANVKTREGPPHPDQDAQFRYLNRQVKSFRRTGNPVISIDTKKKELVGAFKKRGRRWMPKGRRTRYHRTTFRVRRRAKQSPMALTTSHAIGLWSMWGLPMKPRWKVHHQQVSDETGLVITVCHYPPGTSKWNKIEHRLFSFISLNWKGKPLINFETVVNLIGGTRTKTGLTVKAILDTNQYETGVELSKKDMDQLHLTRHKIHPDWNYILSPRPGSQIVHIIV